MPGAGKYSDQRCARVCLCFAQYAFDDGIISRPRIERRQSICCFDLEGTQYVQITINKMTLTMVGFNRRLRPIVCQVIECPPGTASVKAFRRTRQEPQ